jgi:hypothetical protein
MSQAKSCAEDLEKILKSRDDEIEAFGKKVREEVVLPFCREHQLDFKSDTGWFHPVRPSRRSGISATPAAPSHSAYRKPLGEVLQTMSSTVSPETLLEMRPILELLRTAYGIGPLQIVGLLVGDCWGRSNPR